MHAGIEKLYYTNHSIFSKIKYIKIKKIKTHNIKDKASQQKPCRSSKSEACWGKPNKAKYSGLSNEKRNRRSSFKYQKGIVRN